MEPEKEEMADFPSLAREGELMDSRAVPLSLWEWCFYRDPISTPVGDFPGVGTDFPRVSLLGSGGGGPFMPPHDGDSRTRGK